MRFKYIYNIVRILYINKIVYYTYNFIILLNISTVENRTSLGIVFQIQIFIIAFKVEMYKLMR